VVRVNAEAKGARCAGVLKGRVLMVIAVGVSGAAGRMGRRLIALIAEADDLRLAAAVEQEKSPALGEDAGEQAGVGKLGLPVSCQFPPDLDVVVDFSSPEGTLAALRFCSRHKKPIVIGTTGLGDQERAQVESAAKRIPCLLSPNMSVAMNLLFRLAAEVARALGPEYDAEILETHHRFKKDAPSGTALKLAESIAGARGLVLGEVAVFGREGKPGERRRDGGGERSGWSGRHQAQAAHRPAVSARGGRGGQGARRRRGG